MDGVFDWSGVTDKIVPLNERQKCVNYGCYKPVHWDGKRYRPFCSRCQKASYGKGTYADGVTPFKIGMCKNQDGRLDFPCPIDYGKAGWANGMTDLDHINGIPNDNRRENLMELCPLCHQRKSRRHGDYKLNHKKVA